jgi:electron-transferring-flavoprotein dehydrogenase
VPHWLTPRWMHNEGTYTASLGNLCRWLAGQAEELGVEIFPGFAAEVLFDEQGAVRGVATGDMGVGRDGHPKQDYQPGMELHARYTLFAEGARGHLTRQVVAQFGLDADSAPQVYGLGLKELWDIAPEKHQPGLVIHTQGWPLTDAYGGGFLYHQADGQVALGFVVGLGYRNPHLSPFGEFQRWKQHPSIRAFLEGGRRVSYGARVINEGAGKVCPVLLFPAGRWWDARRVSSMCRGSRAAIRR